MHSSYFLKIACILCLILTIQCKKKVKAPLISEKYTVKHVSLRDVITQTGEVEPIVKVDLKSEASGKIEKVYIREGERVKKGQKLIDINPSELLYSKERYDLDVRKNEILKKKAEREYSNALQLQNTGSISKKKLDDLKNDMELADINYQQQRLQLQDIKDQLNKTKVLSPMNGIVVALNVEEGEIVSSATKSFQNGTHIGSIADISRLEVISQIGEVDYIHLEKGQKVVIKPEAVEGTQTTGTIQFISLSAKKSNNNELGTFEVRISIDSIIKGIAPGIFVNVEFVILEKSNVVGVPNHFVKKESNRYYVEKIIPSKNNTSGKPLTKKIAIKVGTTDYKYYEVLSGIQLNDTLFYQHKQLKPKSKKKQRKR